MLEVSGDNDDDVVYPYIPLLSVNVRPTMFCPVSTQ